MNQSNPSPGHWQYPPPGPPVSVAPSIHLIPLSLFPQITGSKDVSFSLHFPGLVLTHWSNLRPFGKYYCPGPNFSPLFPFCLNCSEGDPGIGGFKTSYPKLFSPRVEKHRSRPVVLKLHCLLESSREVSKS